MFIASTDFIAESAKTFSGAKFTLRKLNVVKLFDRRHETACKEKFIFDS